MQLAAPRSSHYVLLSHRPVTLLAALVVLGTALLAIRALAAGKFTTELQTTPLAILAAMVLYGMNHLMRVIRLALLIGNPRLSIRRLAALHLFASALALSAPFRLGDVYRAYELGNYTGKLILGITFEWIERILDAAVLLPLLIVLVAVSANRVDTLQHYGAILAVMGAFVVGSALVIALVPDNLRRVGSYIIRRHHQDWTIGALKAIDDVRKIGHRIPQLLRGRLASLVALTILIWLFELASISIILLAWDARANPVGGLLGFLSQTAATGTLPELLLRPAAPATLAYVVAVQLSLTFLGTAGAIYYIRGSMPDDAR